MNDDSPAPTKLSIEGMHCGSCVRRVSQALAKVPGVSVVDVAIGSAEVRADASALAAAKDAITRAGFTVASSS